MLKFLKRRINGIIVIIGTIPNTTFLTKTETIEKNLERCSADEVEQYLFDEEQNVLVFSNFACALSLPALNWYQKRKISALIKIFTNKFEKRIDQIVTTEYISSPEYFNGPIYNLNYSCTCDLIDISEFCLSLKEQTKIDCGRFLPEPLRVKTDATNEEKPSWRYLRNLISVVNRFQRFGPGEEKYHFYAMCFDVLLEEYRQCIKSGCQTQAMHCRIEAQKFLLVFSDSIKVNISKADQLYRLFTFLSIQYAKYSVWFNPKFFQGYNEVIRLSQDMLQTLQVEKDRPIKESARASAHLVLSDLAEKSRTAATHLYFQTIQMKTNYYDHFNFLQLLHSGADYQIFTAVGHLGLYNSNSI